MPRVQVGKNHTPLIDLQGLKKYFPQFEYREMSKEVASTAVFSTKKSPDLDGVRIETIPFHAIFLFDPKAKSKDKFYFFFMSTLGSRTTMTTDYPVADFIQLLTTSVPEDELLPLKQALQGTKLDFAAPSFKPGATAAHPQTLFHGLHTPQETGSALVPAPTKPRPFAG